MKATTTTQRRAAIADVHRMKAIAAMSDEDYRAMLASYGVEHSTELSDAQLSDLRGRMHQLTDGAARADERASWMKRVWCVVGTWLRANGWKDDSAAIRTVICRAARKKSTREITLSHLKQIYHAWKVKCEQTEAAKTVKRSLEISSLN